MAHPIQRTLSILALATLLLLLIWNTIYIHGRTPSDATAVDDFTVHEVSRSHLEAAFRQGQEQEPRPNVLDKLVDHKSSRAVSGEANSTSKSCLSLNSIGWVEGPRLGNNPNITSVIANHSIFGVTRLFGDGKDEYLEPTLPKLLGQSLCHPASRFLNWTDIGDDSLHYWSFRMIYLIFHAHQHWPALDEAKRRALHGDECEQELLEHRIGRFDYECPDTKFLVVGMGELGLGAIMRFGAVNALFAGIATNRTVLLINNAPVKNGTAKKDAIAKPWLHASCDRHDIQCFFMPPSPCTITEKELHEAHFLTRGEMRRVFKEGKVPDDRTDDRVLMGNIVLRPQRCPENFRDRLKEIGNNILQEVRGAVGLSDPRVVLLEKGLEVAMHVEPEDPKRPYTYFGSHSKPHHASVFYAMRPNPFYAERLDRVIAQIVPADLNPDLTLGLPIRASDKCLMESECLSFAQYMRLMGERWTANKQELEISTHPVRPTDATASIIVTSEAQSVAREMSVFQGNETLRNQVPFNYRFVTNHLDVAQGTGLPANFAKRTTYSLDEIMLSTVASLKAQLFAKYTVGNCCSNFHTLLFDFLREGCGAARDNVGQCLQENEHAEFRVCCMWSNTEECKPRVEARKKAREQTAGK